jgi:hypothetical protein
VYGHPTYHFRDLGIANVESSDDGGVVWKYGDRSPLSPIVRVGWHWALIAMPSAVLPVMWMGALLLRRARRRERERDGLCRTCGYDLRAHRAGERCPECGAIATQATAAKGAA